MNALHIVATTYYKYKSVMHSRVHSFCGNIIFCKSKLCSVLWASTV